jgi:hypothetical protein
MLPKLQKVKLSHYRSRQALRGAKVPRLPDVLGNRYMNVVRLSLYASSAFTTQGGLLVLIFLGG